MEDVVLHSHMQQATVKKKSAFTDEGSHYSQYNTIRGWGEMITDPGQREKGKM